MSDRPGPVESQPWPQTLPAHVMSPGSPTRCHGYDVLGDLAQNYDFAEYLLVALTGKAPSQAWGRAANMALIVLGRVSVAHGSVHAATLSARCAAPPRTSLTIGALGLIEQSQAELDMPSKDTSPEESDAAPLWDGLPQSVREQIGSPPSSAHALALAILRGAGLHSDAQLLTALCIARLPALAAETEAVEAGDLRGYPMRLPEFEYTEEP